jgi:hypothetical protein
MEGSIRELDQPQQLLMQAPDRSLVQQYAATASAIASGQG